jgi:S1-C subfamily serine protease
MPNRNAASPSILVIPLAVVITTGAFAAPDVRVHTVDGNFPQADAAPFANGSGIIVGKRYILTNRHVVQDDAKKAYDGFRVYLGPKYTSSQNAKVVAVCTNFDLALLEADTDFQFQGLKVLDALPPLSTKVVAFGFPLGSRFGVGLTTTGGQISRHPVATTAVDDEQDISIKSALWHDAVLSAGNSGGPLFGHSVLIGINFGYLTSDNKHALAVPGNVVAEFLRLSKCTDNITFTNANESHVAGYEPQQTVVFIEALSNGASEHKLAAPNGASVYDRLTAELKMRLAKLTPQAFGGVQAGKLYLAYTRTAPSEVESGAIVRLHGTMTIIHDIIPDVPIENLYDVGQAASYTTVRGSESYAIPLLPLSGLAQDQTIQELIAVESDRREKESKQRAIELASQKRKADVQRREKAEQRYLSKIRRVFIDSSGKHQIEAAAVDIDGKKVELIRINDRRKVSVPIEKLSADDRTWLTQNDGVIRFYGSRLEHLYNSEVGDDSH